MTNDELLSKTISYLRFPLTVGVVFIHFNIAQEGFSLHGVKYGLENPEWYYHIINFFSGVLPRIAVPLFFFISGFLFFYHTEFDNAAFKKKLKSRMRTLLLPYFLWNVIAALWSGVRLLPCFAWLFPNAYKITLDFSLPAILNTFWNNEEGMFIRPIEDTAQEIVNNIYPIDVPLWYVRELMIMVICAPLLYWLIKKGGYYFIIALGLAWYVAQPFDWGHPYQLITAAFFFSWGAFYSISRADFVSAFRKLSFAPLLYVAIAIADVWTKEQDYNHYIHLAGILTGIVAAVIITSRLLEKGRIKVSMFLANASFFVFALHTLLMGEIGKVVFKLIHYPDSPCFWTLFYFFIPIVTTCVCLGLYMGLKRYFPKVGDVITGGR